MSEYLALLEQLHLPHLLIIVGVALVLVGAVGIVLRASRDVHREEARQVAPQREDRFLMPEPSWLNEQLPHDEGISELLDLSAGGARGRTKIG